MALKGNQKKLDKNNNNRIDAQDFKILKAEKAKGRGQGLQDEKMKPGKPMKAALGAIALGLGAKKMMDKKGSKMPMGMGAAAFLAKKKKEMLGKRMGGVMKARMGKRVRVKDDDSFDTKMKLQKKGVIDKKTGAGRERITKAMKATSLGRKLLLPVAAGVAAQQYLKSKMKKKKLKPEDGAEIGGEAGFKFMLEKKPKKMGGGMMQKYVEGGPAATSRTAEQARRMGQRKKKSGALGGAGRGVGKVAGRRAGLPSLPGKRKEDSSVTLGKFMKSKVDALNESVAAGGMKRERVTQGSTMRRKEDFIKDVAAGKYKKPNKDSAYYKSIGLTGERGDKAVKKFFAPKDYNVGGSVTVKTKLGRNKPTKMY